MADVTYRGERKASIILTTDDASSAELNTQKNIPISVTVGTPIDIGLSAESSIASIELSATGANVEGEPYPGPYEVIPKRSDQILRTAQKVATRNITVFEIPYTEVSNPSGGKTATIGG